MNSHTAEANLWRAEQGICRTVSSDKDRAEQPIMPPSLRWAVTLIPAIHLGKDREISPLPRGGRCLGHLNPFRTGQGLVLGTNKVAYFEASPGSHSLSLK